jgi:hypothetical protein
MKIMITGHRPNKLGGYNNSPIQERIRAWIRTQLTDRLSNEPVLISGMALGVDQ